MKRLLLLFVAILAVSALHAQRGRVTAASAFIDNGDLKAARERINDALVHDASKEWPRTHVVAAKLATEEYKKGQGKARIIEAADHYFKATEFDQKGDARGRGVGRSEKEIKVALTFFMPEFQNAGVDAFNNEDYEVAGQIFERVIKLNKLPLYQDDKLPVDSVFYYYTGLAASRSKNYEKAEKYFRETINLGFAEGDAILLLHEVYVDSGDSSKIADNLKRGFELYPKDDRILTTLINYYLQTEQNDVAQEYLNTAIEHDPENYSFHNARGVLFDLSKEYERAEESYKKAIEFNPNYFEPLLNLGVIYYNKGADEMRKANDITDFKKYEVERKKAEGTFRLALPYMERAHEIRPDDVMVLETLKNLYYRFEMTDKYDQVDSKLKSILE
jgi:tetratricopeptide (TPR) repeat protein